MAAINQGQPIRQRAEITWGAGGTPVSSRFDDPYFSLSDGLEETRHVFLNGNDLPERLTPEFSVAELGFGTGLNLLAFAALTPPDCPVRFTSFEAFPLDGVEAIRALQTIAPMPLWVDWIGGVSEMLDNRATSGRVGSVEVELIWGDARETLKHWPGKADAWFLDGFSPAKNPEMWPPELMNEVARRTNQRGTFATFTAAGAVRRALADAGFAVTRAPGYGRKRHMSRGVLA